jgi:hypothetical protein
VELAAAGLVPMSPEEQGNLPGAVLPSSGSLAMFHELERQIVLLRRDLVETQARITKLERWVAANVRNELVG